MTDIKLDTDGDIWFENGLIDTVEGDEEKLQRLQDALETGLGEWAFDITEGVPYVEAAAERSVNKALLEGSIRIICDRILGENSVRAIEYIEDPSTRTLTANIDTIAGGVQVVQQ